MTKNKKIGDFGENFAAAHLERENYIILERNYRTPYGELDLIARDGETVVFVEVKTRSTSRFGSGFDAITPKKQLTLLRCAEYYAQLHDLTCEMRIDAIEIMLDSQKLTHLKGAVNP